MQTLCLFAEFAVSTFVVPPVCGDTVCQKLVCAGRGAGGGSVAGGGGRRLMLRRPAGKTAIHSVSVSALFPRLYLSSSPYAVVSTWKSARNALFSKWGGGGAASRGLDFDGKSQGGYWERGGEGLWSAEKCLRKKGVAVVAVGALEWVVAAQRWNDSRPLGAMDIFSALWKIFGDKGWWFV